MRIFVTGATGFIGSALVPELLGAGHKVLGLTRSEAGAQALAKAGAEAHRGDIDDLDSLRRGASSADAVIHLAFNHDFSNFKANCEADRRIIESFGELLAGSDRPLLVTSGAAAARDTTHRPATETDPPLSSAEMPRAATEEAADAVAARGVRAAVVRLPQVHDPIKQGLVTYLVAIAREKGVSAYVGDGKNRWPAAHVDSVAHLYRLAIEQAKAGERYHAVAEEGVPLRAIAESLGRGLDMPVKSLMADEAAGHFGWMHGFVGRDAPASSLLTQQRLGWQPAGPTLIADLDKAQF